MSDDPTVSNVDNEQRAKEYSRIKIYISIFSIILSIALLLILIFSGLSMLFRDWALSFSDNPFSVVFFYFTAFIIFSWLIDLPIDYYASFILEHKYGLSNQSFRSWLWEGTKKKILSFLFGAVLIEVLYLCLRFDPQQWWLWCWIIWIGFSVIISKLVPIVIVPLFYKYTEIEHEEIRAVIVKYVSETKLKIKNIYSLNLSKNTKKANAAFMGLGNTKRVVLGDTLIENFTPSEIGIVIAHELGHYVHKHIIKNIGLSVVSTFLAFYCVNSVLGALFSKFGYTGIADVAAFPLVCLVFSVFGIIVMPLQNSFSRSMERQADTYALEKTGDHKAFITTMLKLAEINLSDLSPNPIIEFIFYSHPSLRRRIEWAEAQNK